MDMQKSGNGYSSMQIALHWLIAILVIFQLAFGESMGSLVDAVEDGDTISATDQILGTAHYWVGLIILALVALRFAVRVASGAPSPEKSAPSWMQLAARISHVLFYMLLVATPVLGLLGYYFGEPWDDIHSLNKPAFMVLISVHVLAALYHQFWLKDGTLKRMILPAQ
jgi:cytochrome b561